jgi:mono/diheme cytochrome c family protein
MRAFLLSTPSSNSAGKGGGAERGSAVPSASRRFSIAIIVAIAAGFFSLPPRTLLAQDGQPPAQDAAGQSAAKPADTPSGLKPADATSGQKPAEASSGDIDGETMFATSCGFCHEQGGRVPGKGPKLQGTQRTDEFIINRIKTGKLGSMPAFGGAFSEGQIMAILAYIRGLEE